MIIQSYGDDIPIVVFKQILQPHHILSMIDEIGFINKNNYLKTGDQTISAVNELNETKKNMGVFLDQIYKDRRKESKILSIHEKLVNAVLSKHLANRNIVFEYFKHTNIHNTLVNVYLDKNSYFEHFDQSILTSITFLWNQPKKFTGGSLIFNNYGIELVPELGDVVIFPGFCSHEVSEITLPDDNFDNGRYSISQFFNII